MDTLSLADWRRRLAELYAEVRTMAGIDPEAACEHWRAVRERLYREHPQSPLPPEQRLGFCAAHFAYDPALRFVLPVLANPDSAAVGTPSGGSDPVALPVAIPTSGPEPAAFVRSGWLEVPFPEGTRSLTLFWLPDYAGGLFLSFRDTTGGAETYGGGRYLLDTAKGADLGADPELGTMVLDFNFAYHPSCAFDPRWVCPLTLPENRLDLPVRAGERLR